MMMVFGMVKRGVARGRTEVLERLLLIAVWLSATVEMMATWSGCWMRTHARGRAPAEGVVAGVIMIAFFAGLALLVGRLVGPPVTAKVTCIVSMLQSSSASTVTPTC
jgi:hypothetical protein